MKKCPVCKQPLSTEILQGETIDVCGSCDGVWLDYGELDRIAKVDVEPELAQRAGSPSECRFCHAAIGFGDACPSCGRAPFAHCASGHGAMATVVTEIRGRELEIDRCATCGGTWFDSHEHEVLEPALGSQIRRDSFLAASHFDSVEGPKRAIYVTALVDENFFTPSLGPGTPWGMFDIANVGRREPLQIVVWAGLLGGFVYLVYKFIGPLLVF